MLEGEDAESVESFQASYGWGRDRIWTESRWDLDAPHLKIFMAESKATDLKLLFGGIALLVVSFAVVGGSKAVLEHRLKQA